MHPDSVHVEGEETTGLMRESWKNMDERGRISCVEGLIILCRERGISNFVRERGGEESVSRRHIILLPNGPAFSSAVWSPSSISSMPSLKIEVVCMLGCREAQARVVAI